MNKQECAKVLAKIQLVDNRVVDALTLAEWFDSNGYLDFEMAVAAVRMHRRESTEYLTPAHVVSGARRARAEVRAASERHLSVAERTRRDEEAELARLRAQGVLSD